MEELWLAPKGGLMLGVHRDIKEGKAVNYEMVQIDGDVRAKFDLLAALAYEWRACAVGVGGYAALAAHEHALLEAMSFEARRTWRDLLRVLDREGDLEPAA